MAKRTNQGGKIKNDKKTVKSQTYSSDGEKVIWRFDKIDRTGKFAFDLSRTEFKHKLFMEKMISYNGMTWTEVKKQTHDDNKSKHHFLSPLTPAFQ